jgi:hypothetical protein
MRGARFADRSIGAEILPAEMVGEAGFEPLLGERPYTLRKCRPAGGELHEGLPDRLIDEITITIDNRRWVG